MAYRHSKLAKDLTKEKENEVTWIKAHGMFEDMLKDFCSVEMITQEFAHFNDLLCRSVQSDRSRLNGVSLELLKKIAETMREGYNLSQYVPVLIKLTGRANKIFVNRAQEALLVL